MVVGGRHGRRQARWTGPVSAVVVLCGSLVGWSAELPSREQVSALVEQLASPLQTERAAAAQALEKLGPAVLPLLPASDAVADPAVRDALSKLRTVLEKQLALDSAQAACVTLSGEKSLAEVLQELVAQTHNHLAWADEAPTSLFSATWFRTPFWTAVSDLCRATNRQPQWDSRRGWLLAVPQPHERELASAVSGPFRVAVRDLAWRPLPGKPEKLLRIGMAVQAEPRLQPVFVAIRPGDWSAHIGDTPLSAWNKSAHYELPFAGDNREVPWILDLVAPANVAMDAEIALQGKCLVHVAAGTEPFVFQASKWERGDTIRRGGVTVRLRSAQLMASNGDTHDLLVRMTLSYAAGGPAFESHRIGMFHRAAKLLKADGTSVPFGDYQVLAEADGAIALEYRFVHLAADVANDAFVFEAPTLLLDVPVEAMLNVVR